MSKIYTLLFLFIFSSLSAKDFHLCTKDTCGDATFEMLYLTRTEKEKEFNFINSIDEKNHFVNKNVYRLMASNLPTETSYLFYMVNMEGQAVLQGELTTLNGSDLVFIKNKETIKCKYLSELTWTINPNFLNGEHVRVKLVSKDKKTSLSLTIIPNPIEVKWDDNAHLYLIANNRFANDFTIYGEGFDSNEMVNFESFSGNELLPFQRRTDEAGRLKIGIFPATIGEDGGCAKLIITRGKNSEKKTLFYLWGVKAANNKR